MEDRIIPTITMEKESIIILDHAFFSIDDCVLLLLFA
jgi:hypothetical protein